MELALADSRDELNALRREATDPYRYANREVSTLPLGETQATIDRHRAELDRLDETDRGLSVEIARCEDRLQSPEISRRRAVADVVIHDASLCALVDAVPAAWAWLRTVRGALRAVDGVLGVEFPDRLRWRYQGDEPIDLDVLVSATPPGGAVPVNVPVAADREMIEEWRVAVSRLREDASTELPDVKR